MRLRPRFTFHGQSIPCYFPGESPSPDGVRSRVDLLRQPAVQTRLQSQAENTEPMRLHAANTSRDATLVKAEKGAENTEVLEHS